MTMAHHSRDKKPAGMLALSVLNGLVDNPDSQVSKRKSQIHLGLSPGTLSNIKQGLEAQLLPQLNKYYPPLGAILLGWEDLRLSVNTGLLIADTPSVHVDIVGQFFVFSPVVGCVLPGKVNKKSAGHIGCLVHQTFNVSLICDNTKGVKIGDIIMIEVTKLFWGHRSLPVIQGRLISDGESVSKDDHLEDYDSGIDSTINGATSSNGDIELEESTKNDQSQEKANKKGKKRKREEDKDEVNPNLDESNNESVSVENSPKKKGKKRKREEEISNLDASNVTNDDSVNSPAKKKKKKKKKDSSD